MTAWADNDETHILQWQIVLFFSPRIHGNVLAWAEPAPGSEGSKRVIETILRWEQDGGLGWERSSE